MSLSVATAWGETATLARRQGWRIFPTAFLFLSLPAAVLQAIAPVTAPGHLPEPGLWLLLVPVIPVAGLIGGLAISRLALCPGEGAGDAIRVALRRLIPLIGAALIFAILGVVLALPLVFSLGGFFHVGGEGALAASLSLLTVAWLLICTFFWVRLLLLTPVAAIEPLGPARIVLRSWALTAGHFWRLLILLVAAAILSLVALSAAAALGGIAMRLAAGQPQPGLLAILLVDLVSALLQAAIGGLFTVLVARLYAQCILIRPGGGN